MIHEVEHDCHHDGRAKERRCSACTARQLRMPQLISQPYRRASQHHYTPNNVPSPSWIRYRKNHPQKERRMRDLWEKLDIVWVEGLQTATDQGNEWHWKLKLRKIKRNKGLVPSKVQLLQLSTLAHSMVGHIARSPSGFKFLVKPDASFGFLLAHFMGPGFISPNGHGFRRFQPD